MHKDTVNVRMSDAVGVYMFYVAVEVFYLMCFHGFHSRFVAFYFGVYHILPKKTGCLFVQCLYIMGKNLNRGYIGDIPLILREKRKGRNRKRMNLLDIIGPVMVGPSSSHTAGAVKIGRVSRKLLAEVADAKIYFHGFSGNQGQRYG